MFKHFRVSLRGNVEASCGAYGVRVYVEYLNYSLKD